MCGVVGQAFGLSGGGGGGSPVPALNLIQPAADAAGQRVRKQRSSLAGAAQNVLTDPEARTAGTVGTKLLLGR